MDANIIDYFRKVNGTYGINSEKEYEINQAKQYITDCFSGIISYENVEINTVKREVQISGSSNTLNNDKLNIISLPNETLDIGDSVKWNNEYYLITHIKPYKIIYSKGEMQKCNNTLKVYKNGILYQVPCIFGDGDISISENKFLSLASGHYLITIPSGYIEKSDLNLRFILNDAAYKTIGINNSINGLVKIEVVDDDFIVDDNRELGIANYYSNQVISEILILNGEYIKKYFGDVPFQINVECKENGIVVDNPSVYYISDNEMVCTISETGLVTLNGTGITNIRVIFNNIEDVITIESNVVSQDNYNIVFTPSDTTIKANRSLTLNAMVTNNGINDTLKQVGFEITNADGSLNQYVKYVINNNSITLIAGETYNKFINIKVYMLAYPDVNINRTIKIISLM
jgi:hypothetical protein